VQSRFQAILYDKDGKHYHVFANFGQIFKYIEKEVDIEKALGLHVDNKTAIAHMIEEDLTCTQVKLQEVNPLSLINRIVKIADEYYD